MGTTIHVVSATAVVGHDGPESLAMCGANLGAYRTATAAGHVVGNYASAAVVAARVTCQACADRMHR